MIFGKGGILMRLSDSIESFIKTLLTDESAEVELKRNELAEYFGCAPSQINYVLATRFSPDHGYLTESRRGGGGYIRIVRVVESGSRRLMYLANERIGETLTEEECLRLISQLKEQELVTAQEAGLMASALSTRALGVPIPDALKNALRARMMKSMLMNIASRNQQ
jgi:transcriptional regulator CtsR